MFSRWLSHDGWVEMGSLNRLVSPTAMKTSGVTLWHLEYQVSGKNFKHIREITESQKTLEAES